MSLKIVLRQPFFGVGVIRYELFPELSMTLQNDNTIDKIDSLLHIQFFTFRAMSS